jgi:dTDP-4-amino-4,6-dideoxygalactose transaminase
MADPLAALLMSQLERREVIHDRRRDIYDKYMALLSPAVDELGFTLPSDREGAAPVRHLFHVLIREPDNRDLAIAMLRSKGVGASFHFLPLHRAPAASMYGDGEFDCPIADSVSSRLIRLPFHTQMSESDIEYSAASLVDVVRSLA